MRQDGTSLVYASKALTQPIEDALIGGANRVVPIVQPQPGQSIGDLFGRA